MQANTSPGTGTSGASTPVKEGKRRIPSNGSSPICKRSKSFEFDDNSVFDEDSIQDFAVPAGEHRSKYIFDPIHSLIHLPKYCVDIVDTPQFQRLRDISQLGIANYVYPGATHKRFEHSLGVCHLAGVYSERLASTPECRVRPRDLELVRVAGLCHDLGHGPFSHAFENWLSKTNTPFDHEDMSCKIFRLLVKENRLPFTEEEIVFVQRLIKGDKPADCPRERSWLFDIIHNAHNNIDVDKLDYISRDCYMLGIKSTYEPDRIMSFSAIHDGAVWLDMKVAFDVYELFHTRYALFKKAYCHKVVIAIDHMFDDIFSAADPVYKFREYITDPARFCTLTERFLGEIEFSTDPRLEAARQIIHRLRVRDLYKCAIEFISDKKINITPADLVALSNGGDGSGGAGAPFTEKDIVFSDFVLNYGMNDKDPISFVNFYRNNRGKKEVAKMSPKDVSLLVPGKFQESLFRVYCKNKAHVPAVREAFKRWKEKNGIV